MPSHYSENLSVKVLNQTPDSWRIVLLLRNDTSLRAVNTGNHRKHSSSLFPLGMMLHIFNSFPRFEIHTFTSNTHEGKKGRERVLGGGGDESINIRYVCYLNWVKGTARRRQHGVGRKEICTLLSPICKNTKLQIVALRMKTSKQVTAWTLCLQPDYPHQATNDIIIIIVKKQVWMSLQSGERYMQAKIPKRLFTNLYLPLLMATWEEQGNVLKWTELQVLSSCQI